MPKVKLLETVNISHDGLSVKTHEKGETLELSDEHVNNLMNDGACEIVGAKKEKTEEEKAAEAEAKAKKKAEADAKKKAKAEAAKKKKQKAAENKAKKNAPENKAKK